MQNHPSRRPIGSTIVRGKVELHRLVVTNTRDDRPIVPDIQTEVIRRRNAQQSCVVHFIVRAWSWRLAVREDRLDYVSAGSVVGARCADCVVCSVQCYGVVWVAGPGEILVGADDGHYGGVIVWKLRKPR